EDAAAPDAQQVEVGPEGEVDEFAVPLRCDGTVEHVGRHPVAALAEDRSVVDLEDEILPLHRMRRLIHIDLADADAPTRPPDHQPVRSRDADVDGVSMLLSVTDRPPKRNVIYRDRHVMAGRTRFDLDRYGEGFIRLLNHYPQYPIDGFLAAVDHLGKDVEG